MFFEIVQEPLKDANKEDLQWFITVSGKNAFFS